MKRQHTPLVKEGAEGRAEQKEIDSQRIRTCLGLNQDFFSAGDEISRRPLNFQKKPLRGALVKDTLGGGAIQGLRNISQLNVEVRRARFTLRKVIERDLRANPKPKCRVEICRRDGTRHAT